MRAVFVVAAMAMVTRTAGARPLWEEPDAPVYPDELVDRPLVLLTGMTEVAVSTGLHDHDVPRLVADTPDVSIDHAFGPIAVEASFGPGAALAIAIPTGRFPDAVVIGASTSAVAPDKTVYVHEYLSAEHKFVAVPHGLAFVVGAGGLYDEERIHVPGLQWVRVAGVGVTSQIEIQLASSVALYGGAGISIPVVASTHVEFQPGFDARAGVSVTIASSWDLFATGTLAGASGTVTLGIGAGVAKRFGP
jgi:hypothetical protein